MGKVSFSEPQLEKLFPFYFIIDADLAISVAGKNLLKLFSFGFGHPFFSVFVIRSVDGISVEHTFDGLKSISGSPVRLYSVRDGSVYMEGEFEYLPERDALFFTGDPVVEAKKKTGEPRKTVAVSQVLDSQSDFFGRDETVDKFSLIAENISQGVLLNDACGNILWANKAFQSTTGYTINEMLGMRPRYVLYGDESVHVPSDYVENKIKEKQSFVIENVGYKKNKTKFWFRATIHPLLNERNEITGRFSIIEDITEIKQKEKALEESQQLWKFALEKAGHGVWTYDVPKDEIKFSLQFKALLGYNEQDEVSSDRVMNSLDPGDAAYFKNTMIGSLTKSEPYYTHEVRARCSNGRYKYFFLRGSAVAWQPGGGAEKIVGTMSDIDELKQKDIDMRTSEERLSTLIKNFNVAVLLEKEDRTIILINEEFCRLFSIPVPAADLVGVDCSNAAEQSKVLFKDPGLFVSRIDEILHSQQLVAGERIEMADGKVLERDYIPIIMDGVYHGHLWKYSDISGQIEYENRIKKQREYYHRILDKIPADIVVFSLDHKYQFINKSAVKNDVLREWMIGKDTYEYCRYKGIDTAVADRRSELFKEVVGTRAANEIIDEHTKPDGSVVSVLRKVSPILNEQGEVDFVIGYGIDITQQINSMRYAEAQEERIRNLLQIIKDGVFRCNKDGSFNLYNDSFCRIMNIEKSSLRGDSPLVFYDLLPQVEAARLKKVLQYLRKTGVPQSGTFYLDIHDGERRYVEYIFTKAVREEDAMFVGSLSDITDRVNKEQHLTRIIEKEKELSNFKSSFIRITSHELRTPMSIIQANAEILEMLLQKTDGAGPKMNPEKYTTRINKEILLMTEILNQLMLVGRIETGNIEHHIEPVDIASFLSVLKSDFYDPYSDGRALEYVISAGISKVMCDRKLLRHMLINLVNNAFKYSPQRAAPLLSVSLDDTNIIFEVRDYGIGIPADDKAKLFSPFYRASNVGVIQGTGLGLTVIDYAVKKHGGTITFESKLNEGTVFKISLPQNLNDNERPDSDN